MNGALAQLGGTVKALDVYVHEMHIPFRVPRLIVGVPECIFRAIMSFTNLSPYGRVAEMTDTS